MVHLTEHRTFRAVQHQFKNSVLELKGTWTTYDRPLVCTKEQYGI